MKLKNKKTGEIKPAEAREDGIYLYDKTTERWYKYELSLLAEYWEYYEEPKEYWHIFGTNITKTQEGLDEVYVKRNKEIGNYFSSREKAELAVEKLKAWKRLKEAGFRFERWKKSCNTDGKIIFHLDELGPRLANFRKDLDLLFSGEAE